MSANPVVRTATSLAITVAIAYASCALFFWLLPGPAMSFMNALFHGVDFRGLQASPGAFDFSGFAIGLVVITGWAFLLGALFAYLREPPRAA